MSAATDEANEAALRRMLPTDELHGRTIMAASNRRLADAVHRLCDLLEADSALESIAYGALRDRARRKPRVVQ